MVDLLYKGQASDKWKRARRNAFWTRFRDHLEGKRSHLIDFNEVSQRLRLKNAHYRGTKNVLLDRIVGSVGRYKDFTGAFLPLRESMGARWQHIAALSLDPTSGGLPPIELFQVGDWYFVKDGNHRVSVARQLGSADIEAHVYQYVDVPPGAPPNADIDGLILAAERRDFLEKTDLDTLRPEHDITLTEPGGYTDLLAQIDHYQEALDQIDGVQTPFPEAVTAWYDMIYETSIQIIKQEDVCSMFPDRSTADFFIFMLRHHHELEERYTKPVMLGDAVRDFLRENSSNFLARALRALTPWRTRGKN